MCISICIRECDAQLDDFQQIHVASKCLVVIIGRCLEIADWSCHYARELCILFDKRELVSKRNENLESTNHGHERADFHQNPDLFKLFFQIIGPNYKDFSEQERTRTKPTFDCHNYVS